MFRHATTAFVWYHRSRHFGTYAMKLINWFSARATATALRVILGLAFVSTATAQTTATDGFFNVLSFGATPDGQAKCTDAISKAIDAASSKGGGTVYFHGHFDVVPA